MSSTLNEAGVYIGTSGWSYPHWKGIFYPPEIKPPRYLEYYLTRFHCVELNSSFYHLPKKATVDGWLRRTPDSFRFCPKLSRFITHQKRIRNSGEALQRFFELFDPMKFRMGPVLIQLPPGLSYDDSLVSHFLESLKACDPPTRFAMEVRHPSWINDRFLGLLRDQGVAFVIADSDRRWPNHEAVTADFVYLRLHGPEKLYASDYPDPVLEEYAEKINRWRGKGYEVWAFFNNDFNGFAVKNALKLNEMVQARS
jgi:uncharacterized protein YecE (DUF72 family)